MKVGIAGAGLVGRILAWECALKGWEVTLFDHDAGHGSLSCGYIAAGMIAPYSEFEISAQILLQLGEYSLMRWSQILSSLNCEKIFQQLGSILIAHPQDQVELQRIEQRYQQSMKVKAALQVVNAQQLKILEPELSHFNRGLYFPQEGHIISSNFYNNIKEALLKKNVRWCVQSVQNVTANKIIVNNNEHIFDLACDCRGLGAKQNFFDLRGIRGELIHLQAPDVKLSRPIRILHPRYAIYIVPRPNETYVIGATQIESEDFSPISVKSTLELLSAAYAVHPSFAEARILRTAVQCRPTLPHHLPRIIYQEGFLAINGLYRHGYLAAPALIDDFFAMYENGKSAVRFPELFE